MSLYNQAITATSIPERKWLILTTTVVMASCNNRATECFSVTNRAMLGKWLVVIVSIRHNAEEIFSKACKTQPLTIANSIIIYLLIFNNNQTYNHLYF